MKEMVYLIPKGSCPNCTHKQFVVYERNENLYLTNNDGEVIDNAEISNYAIGKCLRCGKEYDMMSYSTRFIPLTALRKILFDYSPHKIEEENIKIIPNPMEKRDKNVSKV